MSNFNNSGLGNGSVSSKQSKSRECECYYDFDEGAQMCDNDNCVFRTMPDIPMLEPTKEEVKPEGECTHEPKMTCPDCIGDESDNQPEQPEQTYQIENTKGEWSDLKPDEVELYKNSNANVRVKPEQTAEGMVKEIIEKSNIYYGTRLVEDFASQSLSQYKAELVEKLEGLQHPRLNGFYNSGLRDAIDLIKTK